MLIWIIFGKELWRLWTDPLRLHRPR